MCTWWAGFGQIFLVGSHCLLNFFFFQSFVFLHFSLLWCKASWGLMGGYDRKPWVCAHVCKTSPCEWVVGDDPLLSGTLDSARVCTRGPPAPWRLSPGFSLTLNRTSAVFHCGAFPHASLSTYDSLSNQGEGDASVSDLIEPDAHAQPSRCSLLLKQQS